MTRFCPSVGVMVVGLHSSKKGEMFLIHAPSGALVFINIIFISSIYSAAIRDHTAAKKRDRDLQIETHSNKE